MVLKSSASARDADSATNIASLVVPYFTRCILPVLHSTWQFLLPCDRSAGAQERFQRPVNGLAILQPFTRHLPIWRQNWIAGCNLILVRSYVPGDFDTIILVA